MRTPGTPSTLSHSHHPPPSYTHTHTHYTHTHTHYTHRMYENMSVPVEDPARFRIEILFSPGAARNPFEVRRGVLRSLLHGMTSPKFSLKGGIVALCQGGLNANPVRGVAGKECRTTTHSLACFLLPGLPGLHHLPPRLLSLPPCLHSIQFLSRLSCLTLPAFPASPSPPLSPHPPRLSCLTLPAGSRPDGEPHPFGGAPDADARQGPGGRGGDSCGPRETAVTQGELGG
jgi:hypothetical protein